MKIEGEGAALQHYRTHLSIVSGAGVMWGAE